MEKRGAQARRVQNNENSVFVATVYASFMDLFRQVLLPFSMGDGTSIKREQNSTFISSAIKELCISRSSQLRFSSQYHFKTRRRHILVLACWFLSKLSTQFHLLFSP